MIETDPKRREDLEKIIKIANQKIELFSSTTPEIFPDISQEYFDYVTLKFEGKQVPEELHNQIGNYLNQTMQHMRSKQDERIGDSEEKLIKKTLGSKILMFMDHDSNHINSLFWENNYFFQTLLNEESKNEMHNYFYSKDSFSERLKNVNQIVQIAQRSYANMWEFAKTLSQHELGITPEYYSVNLKDLINEVAIITSDRFEASLDLNKKSRTRIYFNLELPEEDIIITLNRGIPWSIIYNNLKNAGKKFEDEDLKILDLEKKPYETFPDGNKIQTEIEKKYYASLSDRYINVRIDNSNPDFIGLIISDNGEPINTNKMLESLIKQYSYDKNIAWISAQQQKKFERFFDNPYYFNALTQQDVTDLAFMANLTSNNNKNSISSGLGLYGTRLMLELVGGAYLYTVEPNFNQKTVNPHFLYIIPRDATKFKDNQKANEHKLNLIQTGKYDEREPTNSYKGAS